MKKRRIFIALAFIVAIGSAFTSKPVTNAKQVMIPGYIKPHCDQPVILCNNKAGFACRLTTGQQAYQDHPACSIPLTRDTP